MSNSSYRQPQVPFETLLLEKAGWFDWRCQDYDDHAFFVRNPDAAYRIREWRLSDDRGHDLAEIYDMIAVTIVFRCGCRWPEFIPKTRKRKTGFPHTAWLAEVLIRKHPVLGVDGVRTLESNAS